MAEREQPAQRRDFEQNNRETTSATGPLFAGSPDANEDLTEAGRDESEAQKRTSNRGFAVMDRDKQKRIASEGGRAAHKQGVAHEWNKDEARKAGRKGGQTVSQNREHMSEIGRKGGQNSGQRRQRNEE